MKTFLCVLAAAWLLAACARPAAAFIERPPPTLGRLCIANHIAVLQVEKFSAEKGVIVFKTVRHLKGQPKLREEILRKQVIDSNVSGGKTVLDWAGEGKTAVFFGVIDSLGGKRIDAAYVYIDNYWYLIMYDEESATSRAVRGEPLMLAHYCGAADKLGDYVAKLLQGEEVVVPAMVGGNKNDVEQRRAKVRDIRASLKPDLVGKVQELSEDGKRLTLAPAPTATEEKPAPVVVRVSEGTRLITQRKDEAAELAVGQTVWVWLEIGDQKIAATVQVRDAK